MKEKTINSTRIYDGKIIQVDKDEIEVGGRKSTREVVHNAGGVSVLALDEKDNVILVKQFRYPSKEELYEIPGGKAECNETLVESGMRELKEESGYVSDNAIYFGYIYPTVAYSSEIIHLVLTKNCKYEKQCLDEGEHVEVIKVPFKKALDMVLNNEIVDGKTMIAILKYNAIKNI